MLPNVFQAAKDIKCEGCQAIVRPHSERPGHLTDDSREFGDVIVIDQGEVVLSDGTRVMFNLIVDLASGFTIVHPLNKAIKTAKAADIVKSIEQYWMSWARAPRTLSMDQLSDRMGVEMDNFCLQHGIRPDPIPAGAKGQDGRAERAISEFKEKFSKVNEMTQLNDDDSRWGWCSHVTLALNTYVRRSGFTAYQYVFGRSLRTATDLSSDEVSLPALSMITKSEAARRSDEIRSAAIRAVSESTNADKVKRVLTAKPHYQGLPQPGTWVYYWCENKTTIKSKHGQPAEGLTGPALVVTWQGPARCFVSCFGKIILVSPEQMRPATPNELQTHEELNKMPRSCCVHLASIVSSAVLMIREDQFLRVCRRTRPSIL